jgi:hypothetical protein
VATGEGELMILERCPRELSIKIYWFFVSGKEEKLVMEEI